MRVAAVQTTYDGDADLAPQTRIDRVCEQIRGAVRPGDVDLIVLPELWAVGAFRPRDWAGRAEPLDGPTVSAMSALARDLGATVHVGSVVERDGDDLFNTAVVVGPDGGTIATYRKIHLFRAGGREAEILTAGEEVVVADIPLRDSSTVRAGLATCYELRFPELFRALTDLGAAMLIVPASWPLARIDHWTTLLRARAIENQAVTIGVGATGLDGRTPMAGASRIVDAQGRVLAEAGSAPEVLVVDVDLAAASDYRDSFGVLGDRRLRVEARPAGL